MKIFSKKERKANIAQTQKLFNQLKTNTTTDNTRTCLIQTS